MPKVSGNQYKTTSSLKLNVKKRESSYLIICSCSNRLNSSILNHYFELLVRTITSSNLLVLFGDRRRSRYNFRTFCNSKTYCKRLMFGTLDPLLAKVNHWSGGVELQGRKASTTGHWVLVNALRSNVRSTVCRKSTTHRTVLQCRQPVDCQVIQSILKF